MSVLNFHILCVALFIGGTLLLVPTSGMLTTFKAKLGAAICLLGVLLEGLFWTGAIGSVLNAVN